MTLAGHDTYSGQTNVYQGELVVTHSYGLADGSSLAVGNPLLFAPVVADGAGVAPAATAVPEPAALPLLAAGFLIAATARLRRLWGRRLACGLAAWFVGHKS